MMSFRQGLGILMLAGMGLHASAVDIGNCDLMIRLRDDQLSIHSMERGHLLVEKINLPGEIRSHTETSVVDEIWGAGRRVTVMHDEGKRETSLTIYNAHPFVHLHTSLKSDKGNALALSRANIADLQLKVGPSSENLVTLGSGGMKPITEAEGSYCYSVLANPDSRNGIVVGWLTQLQGVGIMEPVYDSAHSTFSISTGLEFGHYTVPPGKSRETDILVIGFFDDVRLGLEQYGETIAKAYNITLPPKPEVYCTWYHRDLTGSGASTEEALKENSEFAKKHLAPFGLNVMQIDDHWQDSMIDGIDFKNSKKERFKKVGKGPIKTFVEANKNFPNGMAHTADVIAENGFVPGIWFMPFAADTFHDYFDKAIYSLDRETGKPYETKGWSGATIDSTSPAGEAFLRERFKRIHDWGYRYFKVDGLHMGAPSDNIYVNRVYEGKPVFGPAKIHDPAQTFVQCFRRGMDLLREEAPNTFVLGCAMTQNMLSMGASYGMVDAMRVGPDNDKARMGEWSDLMKGADFAGNLWFLNNRVWYNDPDPYYVRSESPLERARWMVSWQTVSGVMGTSSMQYENLNPERLELIKRSLPTHTLPARPVDILNQPVSQIWTVGNERMDVVGLFNAVESNQTEIVCSFDKMGLNGEKAYECYEFWSDTYVGQIKDTLNRTLQPASCEVMALREAKSHPQVLSTSRHIMQGLMDIECETWNPEIGKLEGNSHVVAEDLYELRIVVPDGYTFTKAACAGLSVESRQEGRLLRVRFVPKTTGGLKWSVAFSGKE